MLLYAIRDIDKKVLFLKKRINPKNKLFSIGLSKSRPKANERLH